MLLFVWAASTLHVLLVCLSVCRRVRRGDINCLSVVCVITSYWSFKKIKAVCPSDVCVSVCSQVSCPYSEVNLNKEGLLPDRLSGERPPTLSGPHPRGRRPDPNANNTTQNSSTQDQPEGPEDAQNRFNPLLTYFNSSYHIRGFACNYM